MRSGSRRRTRQRRVTFQSRRGFTLVEAMVAIVLMTIGLLGLAGMTAAAARKAAISSVSGQRAATVMQEVNRLSALSYDSLPGATGCQFFANAEFPHTRCITVTDIPGGSGYRRVQVIITPASVMAKPETTYFTRSKGKGKNPLDQ